MNAVSDPGDVPREEQRRRQLAAALGAFADEDWDALLLRVKAQYVLPGPPPSDDAAEDKLMRTLLFGEPPRRAALAQEAVARMREIAAAPPVPNLQALPDGTQPPEELAQGWFDQHLNELQADGTLGWKDLLAVATLTLAGTGHPLRRSLLDLSAFALLWVEAIETRSAGAGLEIRRVPGPDGDRIPRRDDPPPRCTCTYMPHAVNCRYRYWRALQPDGGR